MKKPRKQLPHKKWSLNQRKAALRRRQTPLEIALTQIPKLSVAECKLLWKALNLPNAREVKNIKRAYQKGDYKNAFDAPVRILEPPPHDPSWGRWVNNRWRPYSKKFVKEKKRQWQLTISDQPEKPH